MTRLPAWCEIQHATRAARLLAARSVLAAVSHVVVCVQALGMVMQLPEKDDSSMTRRQLNAMLDVCMGGRVAEELIFGADSVTTGACCAIARRRSCVWNACRVVVAWAAMSWRD